MQEKNNTIVSDFASLMEENLKGIDNLNYNVERVENKSPNKLIFKLHSKKHNQLMATFEIEFNILADSYQITFKGESKKKFNGAKGYSMKTNNYDEIIADWCDKCKKSLPKQPI